MDRSEPCNCEQALALQERIDEAKKLLKRYDCRDTWMAKDVLKLLQGD